MQEDGAETLVCWPPKASILNTGSRTGEEGEERRGEGERGGSFFSIFAYTSFSSSSCSLSAHSDAAVVEAVMKMWPPPAPPKDRDPERDTHRGGSHPPLSPSCSDSNQPIRSSSDGNQPIRSSRPADQADPQKVLVHAGQQNPAAVNTHPAQTQGLKPTHTHVYFCKDTLTST